MTIGQNKQEGILMRVDELHAITYVSIKKDVNVNKVI